MQHLHDMKHPNLENMAYWSYMLFGNTFPANAHRVYHNRGFIGLRRLIRVLLLPLSFPAALMSSLNPSFITTAYGSFLLLLLWPVIAWRFFKESRVQAQIRADYLGT